MALGGRIEEIIRREERKERTSRFDKPMMFDIFTVIMFLAFGIAVFYNITLLNSPVEWERINATINIALASLFLFGLGMKTFFDHLKEVHYIGDIEVVGMPVTSSRMDLASSRGFLSVMLGFGMALGGNLAISVFLVRVPLSIFDLTLERISFAIISSVSEEMFFLSLQDIFGSFFGIATIPLNVGVFALYHNFVYAHDWVALLYVSLGRLIYAIVYHITKRPSASFLAHLANNIIVLIRI